MTDGPWCWLGQVLEPFRKAELDSLWLAGFMDHAHRAKVRSMLSLVGGQQSESRSSAASSSRRRGAGEQAAGQQAPPLTDHPLPHARLAAVIGQHVNVWPTGCVVPDMMLICGCASSSSASSAAASKESRGGAPEESLDEDGKPINRKAMPTITESVHTPTTCWGFSSRST